MKRNQSQLKCRQCEKDYFIRFSLKDVSKYCSIECKGIYQKGNFKGTLNPNYRGGKSKCIDCSLPLSQRYCKAETRCRKCFFAFSEGKNASNWKGGKGYPDCVNCQGKTADWYSILCRNCYKGALHPFWKGGTSTIQSLIRALPENRQWIKQCMYRDRFSCQNCDVESNGTNLQVHHVKQFALILKENNIKTIDEAKKCSELWDMDNGVTLCKKCHKLTESFNKKLL